MYGVKLKMRNDDYQILYRADGSLHFLELEKCKKEVRRLKQDLSNLKILVFGHLLSFLLLVVALWTKM
jgi:hypothetical protein